MEGGYYRRFLVLFLVKPGVGRVEIVYTKFHPLSTSTPPHSLPNSTNHKNKSGVGGGICVRWFILNLILYWPFAQPQTQWAKIHTANPSPPLFATPSQRPRGELRYITPATATAKPPLFISRDHTLIGWVNIRRVVHSGYSRSQGSCRRHLPYKRYLTLHFAQ